MSGYDMNVACLVGRIGRDPELKHTPSGDPVCTFSLAWNKGEKTGWIQVTCWRKTAEFVNQYLGKGRLVSIVGELDYREWVDNEGKKQTRISLTGERVNALDPKKDTGESSQYTKPAPVPVESDDPLDGDDPFADE